MKDVKYVGQGGMAGGVTQLEAAQLWTLLFHSFGAALSGSELELIGLQGGRQATVLGA